MRKDLLIKADPEKGVEIINQLLEFDGVINKHSYTGKESVGGYFINGNKIIECYEYLIDQSSYYKIMTLEEFQTKFPFKPGDQVVIKGDEELQTTPVYKIKEGLIWDSEHEEVVYQLDHVIRSLTTLAGASELVLYGSKSNNEETTGKYNIEKYLKVWEETEHGLEVVVNDKFELKEVDGKFYLTEKRLEYPKTYEECCDFLGPENYKSLTLINVTNEEDSLYTNFIKLIRCRNAYWKLYGERIGLGKSWEPDYKDGCIKYTITAAENEIYTDVSYIFNYVLIFPTEEMRNAFYGNFKDLIEKCKELL
jgi:hypothetical protein